MKRGRIAMILSGFPRRSETFLLNEVVALDAAGLLGAIFATRQGDAVGAQPAVDGISDRIQYLASRGAEDQAAEVIQRLKGQPTSGIHAYFAHFPAEVAARAAERLEVPYGFSLHARDARKIATSELAARARRAACVVACNPDVVAPLRDRGIDVPVIPHGVDLCLFRPRPSPPEDPLRLLAVGRLVEKKGFAVLIEAVAQLRVPFRLRIVGEGPDRDPLQSAIVAAGLEDRVELCGGLTHADLPAEYGNTHLVVVPSIEDHTGDRDGLPNVVLEAMASGRPVIASDMGAIPTAVVDGQTGLLLPPGDSAALAAALEGLARQPVQRERLARGGMARVERDFDLERCTARLTRFLESAYA
jgi:glycosyltransferase involved in cell wall biosynthesis